MKTIFKHLFVMMSMLSMTLAFVGCSDDDNDVSSSSIVGTWSYEEEDYYEEITFKANGIMIVESEEYYNGEWESWTERGTYELDGDKLIANIDDEIAIVTVVSVTSSKLVLKDEDGDRWTYYRVE